MPLADTLLRMAEVPPLYRVRWTDQILTEVTRTLIRRFGKSPEQAARRESAMRAFFRDSIVADYEQLIPEMENHPKDRHVLAAAVKCRAGYLVTSNLRDFPSRTAERHGVAVVGPSAFLRQLWMVDRPTVKERLDEQSTALGVSMPHLLDRLSNSVPGFVTEIRRDWDRS